MEFVKPTIEYSQLWPLFVVFGVACGGVLVEAFLPRPLRYVVQTRARVRRARGRARRHRLGGDPARQPR